MKTPSTLRLMCVLAHPDDESLATGGVLAQCATEGVATYLLTATRGERGRYGDGSSSPGPEVVGPRSRSRARRRRRRARAARGEGARLPRWRAGPGEPRRGDGDDRRPSAPRPAARGDHVRTRGRLRPHRSHRDQPADSGGGRVRRGSRLRHRWQHRRAAPRVEAVFHRVEPREVGGLSGGVEAARVQGGRRRAPGDSVAVVGDHHGGGHQPRLADGVARGVVSRDADVDLRPPRRSCPTSTTARSGGRRSSTACTAASTAAAPAKPICWRGCDERPHRTARSIARPQGAAGDVGRRVP